MASPNDNATPIQVASVVSFYMSAALVMVFVNKAVLNGSPDLPLLFLLIQLLMAVVLLHVAAAFSPKVVIPKLEIDVAKKLVPVVAVNVIGLVFNTLCLRDVEASFFQIARGLVLPLTIIVSSIHTHSLPSRRVIVAAVAVTFGFFTGVSPSKDLPAKAVPSILSLVYGVLSSLFIAFHAVLIKYSLQYCNNSTIELAYWTNIGSAVFLLPFVVFGGELFRFRALLTTPIWDGRLFFWGSMTTGVFGFLLCVAGVLSIKVTSPITHMFSGAVRSVLQTLLGVWIFSDILTINRATSIMIILGGTMFYTWVKSVETTPPKPHPRSIDLESNSDKDSKSMNEETIVWEPAKEKYPPQR
jgi:GDP-fucose transporter C1